MPTWRVFICSEMRRNESQFLSSSDFVICYFLLGIPGNVDVRCPLQFSNIFPNSIVEQRIAMVSYIVHEQVRWLCSGVWLHSIWLVWLFSHISYGGITFIGAIHVGNWKNKMIFAERHPASSICHLFNWGTNIVCFCRDLFESAFSFFAVFQNSMKW